MSNDKDMGTVTGGCLTLRAGGGYSVGVAMYDAEADELVDVMLSAPSVVPRRDVVYVVDCPVCAAPLSGTPSECAHCASPLRWER